MCELDHHENPFQRCADNGNATHLVSYDPHLEAIDQFYSFKVCRTLTFLFELREELSKKGHQ
jgi:hypothetical protein